MKRTPLAITIALAVAPLVGCARYYGGYDGYARYSDYYYYDPSPTVYVHDDRPDVVVVKDNHRPPVWNGRDHRNDYRGHAQHKDDKRRPQARHDRDGKDNRRPPAWHNRSDRDGRKDPRDQARRDNDDHRPSSIGDEKRPRHPHRNENRQARERPSSKVTTSNHGNGVGQSHRDSGRSGRRPSGPRSRGSR